MTGELDAEWRKGIRKEKFRCSQIGTDSGRNSHEHRLSSSKMRAEISLSRQLS